MRYKPWEQQLGTFFKSLNQITIASLPFPAPFPTVHSGMSPPLPFPHFSACSCAFCLQLTWRPRGRLQSDVCPIPAGLHMKPGWARGSSRLVPFHRAYTLAGREYSRGNGQGGGTCLPLPLSLPSRHRVWLEWVGTALKPSSAFTPRAAGDHKSSEWVTWRM